jgi:chemosensory pili system protein ChpA (sensor histidine kinase/response regulator)
MLPAEPSVDNTNLESDLGPLAWVLEELRKSLDGATQALRRFVRDAELSRGSDIAALDDSHLRIARQQLHQAVGALEMVGLEVPARMLRAMEALVQKFVQRPEFCSDEAALTVERASFALTDYLETVLKAKNYSSVALFPQYRDVLALMGDARIHPADLWTYDWRWIDVEVPKSVAPMAYGSAVRLRFDSYILNVVKSGHIPSAIALRDIGLGFAAQQTDLHARVLWAVAAAFFEAEALDLVAPNVYTKRAASQLLLHYRSLVRGEYDISERLVRDLLFFCSQAVPSSVQEAPALRAVQLAYGLVTPVRVDFEKLQFGRFDPAVLVQARKRVASTAEIWSSLSGGETGRIKTAADQFGQLTDSILKLHPENSEFSAALLRAIDSVTQSGAAPGASLAMEVATAVLYLQAAYEDMDPNSEQMVERGKRLAERLDHVVAGGQPEPLDLWMEELYRRVSDRQVMGSVVDELRATLGEVETALDTFFRHPDIKTPLQEVPGRLAQMRGVFSVLGLDQAALAALRMRDSVERVLVASANSTTDQSLVFERLGNSLGALGFLIDMLSYQRELAKKLFVYDEVLGEFRSMMGRQKIPPNVATIQVDLPEEAELAVAKSASNPLDVAVQLAAERPLEPHHEAAESEIVLTPQVLTVAPMPVVVTTPAAVPVLELEDDDAELRDIFLEEAQDVVVNGLAAVSVLLDNPADIDHQTSLRRAFHTLKGSSRMVGLNEFGEAAWAFEQLLNAWLPQQLPASPALVKLAVEALQGFDRWIKDIADRTDEVWRALPFRRAADSLRLDEISVDLDLAEAQGITEPDVLTGLSTESVEQVQSEGMQPEDEASQEQLVDFMPTQMNEFSATQVLDSSEPLISKFGESALGKLEPVDLLEPALSVNHDFLDLCDLGESLSAPLVDEDVLAGLALPDMKEPAPLVLETEASETDQPELEPAPAHAGVDEQIKVIGSLRLSIALYNVYLNEADEWSRRLLTELTEWSLELGQPISDSTVGLAHSLAGSSATVGFMGLSELARALEHALEHIQLAGSGLPEHARLFVDVAEDIRRLLHQFAAGFIKSAAPELLPALKAVFETDLSVLARSEPELLLAFDPLGSTVEEDILQSLARVDASLTTSSPPILPVDEEIGARDSLDVDLFPIFEEEALELLPKLSAALRLWSDSPNNLTARQESLRVLHTLKGSARLAGAMRLGEMAHRMESAAQKINVEAVHAGDLGALLVRLDAISSCFESLRAMPEQDLVLPEALATLSDVSETEPALSEHSEFVDSKVISVWASAQAVPTPTQPVRRPAAQTIRVKSQLIDRMVDQAGEVMMSRSRLESRLSQLRGSLDELTTNLSRLRAQLHDIETQSESQMQSRLAQTKEVDQGFDPLEFDRFTRVQELTRMMAESVHDVATLQRNLQQTVEGVEDDLVAQARQTRELQRDLLRTRMVEFESIAERLHGVVRQAAKDFDKPVKLDILGGALEMDRGVLDRAVSAFEHILRNAVGHGIESAVARLAAGKPATGSITVTLEQQSNDVAVTFHDDGGGLNLVRIREKALAAGQITADQDLSDETLANLIFTSGLSTAAEVTEMAGRGIGMDIVRTEVNALGGRIELSTQQGQGTQFKLVLPLTTAVNQVVLLRIGDLVIGVPASLVDLVRRMSAAELDVAYLTEHLEYNDHSLDFFWAGAMLQTSVVSTEPRGKTAPVVIFRSAGQRIAVHVDEVLGNQEVVVKNLGPQLSRLHGLAGMSVLVSGAVVLIYNPVALVAAHAEQVRAFVAAPRLAAVRATEVAALALTANQAPLILVVDDSITVRRVTQRLLKREGYRVALAADGLLALEVLQGEKPAVVLSDIEMPRMDGFDLVRNIRADKRLQDLPVIMITSRIAEKHRDYAYSLKVDHYLGKPYPEDELIALVHGYCHAQSKGNRAQNIDG